MISCMSTERLILLISLGLLGKFCVYKAIIAFGRWMGTDD
jgi:hypothetical protein